MDSKRVPIHYRYPLPDNVYERLAIQVYTPVLLDENVIIAFPPLYGKDHTIRYMWERTADRIHVLASHVSRFQFGHVPLAYIASHNPTQWIIQLLQSIGLALPSPTHENLKAALISRIQDEGKHIVFFVNVPENFPEADLSNFLNFAQQVYYFSPDSIHFIIAIDQQWDEEEYISILAPYRSLCQHLIQPGLYTDTEVRHFIHYWSQKWNQPISLDTEEKIIRESGGILLLAKAAVRLMAQSGYTTLSELTTLIQSHPEYALQIRLFTARLTDTQKMLLTNLYSKQAEGNEKEMEHMRNMKIIELTPHGYKIRAKSLERHLHAHSVTPMSIFLASTEQTHLSVREQVLLKALLTNHGQILSRDYLASLLFQSNDTRSDWSIDQAVSRLRKKLLHTHFSSLAKIDTKKGKGFLVTLL